MLNIKKNFLFICLVLGIVFSGCTNQPNYSNSKKSTQDLNQNPKEESLPENIKEGINLIDKGNFGEAMHYLYTNGGNTEGSLEYNLLQYATAMYDLYGNKSYDGSTRVRSAKRSIGNIKDDNCGPYSEEVKKYKKFCDFDKYDIDAKHEVEIGMNEVEVLFARGYPLKINTTQTADNKTQQYVYDDGFYIYLENVKVTTIQN